MVWEGGGGWRRLRGTVGEWKDMKERRGHMRRISAEGEGEGWWGVGDSTHGTFGTEVAGRGGKS